MDSNSKSWLHVMNSLKDMHSKIYELIGDKNVAFLDVPVYFNVGDLLIYKGTEQFFKNYGITVTYRGDCNNLNYKSIEEADVILFQGGGNFGDLYDVHQVMREDIVSRYPNKRIICLPQTIYFESELNKKKSEGIFKKHNDFHFMVRDERSLEIAKKFTDKAFLICDMAHSLHPLVDVSEITNFDNNFKIINMVRVDIEKNKNINRINKRSFDWCKIINLQDVLYYNIYSKVAFFHSYSAKINMKNMKFWEKCSDELVFRSINYFYIHDEVHTDRLHGLILASLLGKRVKLYDNSYGKNSAYYQLWLRKNPLISDLIKRDKVLFSILVDSPIPSDSLYK